MHQPGDINVSNSTVQVLNDASHVCTTRSMSPPRVPCLLHASHVSSTRPMSPPRVPCLLHAFHGSSVVSSHMNGSSAAFHFVRMLPNPHPRALCLSLIGRPKQRSIACVGCGLFYRDAPPPLGVWKCSSLISTPTVLRHQRLIETVSIALCTRPTSV